jgi:hypothetical protein
MTKTAATKLARQARRYGYYSFNEGRRLAVKCPCCGTQVEADISIHNPGSPMVQLDAAVVLHLTDVYGADDPVCRVVRR